MHNYLTRLNAVLFFAVSVLLAMAALCSFSTFNFQASPIIKTLKVRTIRSLRNHASIDRALFSFDLDADFTPLFHWNIHQLNVFVVAEYESKVNKRNNIVVWDRNITSNVAHLVLKDEFVKYGLIDQGSELRGKNVSLRLMWDNMPITGRLYFEKEDLYKETKDDSESKLYKHSIKLPKDYKS